MGQLQAPWSDYSPHWSYFNLDNHTGYFSSAQSSQCFLLESYLELIHRFLMANCRMERTGAVMDQ
jgi:hypothetical protein